MKVLIIGAGGMLARPVVQELDKQGYQLRLFSRNVNQSMFLKDYEIVNGDVFNTDDLNKAIKGCDAIHINLSLDDEATAVQNIVKIALQEKITLISTISGSSVSKKNRWFPMIDNKFRAEQAIIQSGIPYLIFRASWFFESLDLLVRDGKATMIGKQNNPYHWIAAKDYARMVSTAYKMPDTRNKIFYVLGQESFLMKDLLKKYCEIQYPEIKKVNTISTRMLKFIAVLSKNKELKKAAEMFGYFEKTKEIGDTQETYSLLGKPETSLNDWVYSKN